MSQLRKDRLTGQLVYIAEERNKRPMGRPESIAPKAQNVGPCPFCPENRYMTPETIYEDMNGEIRMFLNLYPIVEGSERNSGKSYGEHYVILDTASHTASITDFSNEHMFRLLRAFQAAYSLIAGNPKIKYIQLFKNDGFNAGASQEHSHWQIAGLSILPAFQRVMLKNAVAFYKTHGKSILQYEIEKRRDLVFYRKDGVTAFCPYASAFSHEIIILPEKSVSGFTDMSNELTYALAICLQSCIAALRKRFPGLNFNVCFYPLPVNMPEKKYRGWRFFIRIIPRIGNIAGLELSTGLNINPCAPETAAENLSKFIH